MACELTEEKVMTTTSSCESCGMPIESGRYCGYCTDEAARCSRSRSASPGWPRGGRAAIRRLQGKTSNGRCSTTWPPCRPGATIPGSRHADIRPALCAPATGTVRSANFGVLAAVQLHDVGVVAAPWLCDVGVLAAVQLNETEAAPGEQLAQMPH